MIAKLLIHPLSQTRVGEMEKILTAQDLKKDHPDVLWLEEEKLGVEAAKKIRQHLSLKPYSAQGRAVVVLNTQVMTVDAQNSLLKTLEEPPTEAIILLGADSDKNILPTVLSRCEIVSLDVIPAKAGIQKAEKAWIPDQVRDDIAMLQTFTIEQRFEYIEKLEDKDQFLVALIVYFRQQLITHHSSLLTEFTKELMKAEKWRQANGNMRAILEYLMLRLPD